MSTKSPKNIIKINALVTDNPSPSPPAPDYRRAGGA